MNLQPPPKTEDIELLRKWCDDLYEFLKYPAFAGGAIFGDSTNYSVFASDGEVTQEGTARTKKEVVIEATSLAPGSTGPDATILGNYLGYSYDIGDDSVADFEIPHDWDTTTALEVKIYWYINEAYSANSGEVQWRIQWSACPTDASEAVDAPTHTGTIDYGDQNIPATAKYLTKTAAGTIAAASLSAGDVIGMTIDRVALDGGNNPTADPVIVRIEVEYYADKLGEAT